MTVDRKHGAGRRRFIRTCVSAAAAVSASPGLLAQQGATMKPYDPVTLADANGRPLRVDQLAAGECYVFFYPYVTTPCFLMNLGKPTDSDVTLRTERGNSYRWQGGVGPERSIVAFSAICAHKMTYPSESVSFINYRHNAVRFVNSKKEQSERSQVIYCCSERSVYDPAKGAQVLGGPAPQPLAAIHLEYDTDAGSLQALGTYGGELFDQFINAFEFRLALDFRITNISQRVTGATTVIPSAEYSEIQILC
ncbi:MAG: hypothetical protein OEQ39_13260 [Gammaproteobacteria bacterium]|nr:hypothetical protein [Gammaproteobacteria bacterium]MDH3466166.1 hypothetical protein [Gammaproteobacteria bacterium]